MYNDKVFLQGLLFTFVLRFNYVFTREEWIDPHDMSVKKPSELQITASDNNCQCPLPVPIKSESHHRHSQINFAIWHYKRAINLLLGAVVVDRSDTFSYKGQLHINIPYEEYDKLISFTKSNSEDSATLRSIDQILSKILIKPRLERVIESLISWTDQIYFTFYNRTTGVLAACIFVLFISYKLLRANLTIWAVVKYLIFLGWVIDFAFTWIRLMQESEINKMAESLQYSVPPECDPNKMGYWQYIKYSFGYDTCKAYHQTMFKEVMWSIGPIVVLSHQFGAIVLTPASYIGEAVGSFTNGILRTLPWGINIVLLPVLLIFSAIIICIALSFMMQTSFRVNIFHVLQLEFGKNERRAVGDVLSGCNLTNLINALQHRNMIEEVRQADAVENAPTNLDSNFREETIENSKVPNTNVAGDSVKANDNCAVSNPSIRTHNGGSGDHIECIDK